MIFKTTLGGKLLSLFIYTYIIYILRIDISRDIVIWNGNKMSNASKYCYVPSKESLFRYHLTR